MHPYMHLNNMHGINTTQIPQKVYASNGHMLYTKCSTSVLQLKQRLWWSVLGFGWQAYNIMISIN